MSYAPLNNVTAPDTYTLAATVRCPNAQRINIDVQNGSIYYCFGHGSAGIVWDDEVFLGPGFRSFDAVPGAGSVADAVQIRAAVPAAQIAPAQQAQVTVQPR